MAEENIVIKIKADIGVTKEVIDAVTKAMENLGKTATIVTGNVKVTNKNLEDTNKVLGQVAQTATKTTNAIEGNASALKKSNQQWTNLALVVQDLPFGFRGIQNNLPALIGGMAGVTGGIYFAISAIIALFTAWDMGIFGATKSTNEWKKSIKETNDEIRKSLDYTNAEVSNLQGLISVMTDVNSTESQRNKALKEIKEAISKVDEAEGKKVTGLYSAITAVNLYTQAIQQQQMQEVIGKRIAEITLSQIELRNKQAIETAKANRGIHPINFFMGNKDLDNLNSEIIANETLLRQLEELRTSNTKALLVNPFSKFNAKPQTGGTDKFKQDTSLLDKLKAEEKLYRDDMFMKRAIGLEIINEEERLAIQRAIHEKASEETLKNIRVKYAIERKIIEQDTVNAIQQIRNKAENDRAKQAEKDLKDQLEEQTKFAKRQTNNIETELSVQDKLNKDNLSRRIDYTKQALAKLAVLAAMTFNPASLSIYLDAFDKINAKLKGLGEQWDQTSKTINNSINNLIISSLTLVGESLGKALAGENVDFFNSFAMLIADALTDIGKALITYATLVGLTMDLFADPLTWPVALAAGIAAVAAGAFLKSKLSKKQNNTGATAFANGGIVSGPTMGLIGEYPGAKANPEVVAPLDKLKDMLGGQGGGQFVLKGNDLVLALNRSETSLNLRRGV